MWRRIQALGLTVQYENGQIFNVLIRVVINLAFIPEKEITKIFIDIKEKYQIFKQINDKYIDFLEYFERTYV